MTGEQLYSGGYYSNRDDRTRYSAELILSRVLDVLPEVRSVIDIGCGVGTWLSVAQAKGVERVDGYDGPWVTRENLEIPEECFHENNLSERLALTSNYDLGISLEVLEHIPADSADELLAQLSTHCRFLLFGAAVPQQGGTGHINERPQSYWHEVICSQGFVAYDLIRPTIWSDAHIPYWYKQNPLLYVRNEEVSALPDTVTPYRVGEHTLLDVVHPGLLDKHIRSKERRSSRARFKRLLGIRSR